MSTVNFTIPLGFADIGKLETDDDFRREAERLLPEALTQTGEKTAESAWNELQKSFRSAPGFKVNSSASDKAKFVREGGRKHRREASTDHQREVTEHIIHQSRGSKGKAGQSG